MHDLPKGYRLRSCTYKQPYGANAARRLAEHLRLKLDDSSVSAYPCHFCGSWHIGHTPSMRTIQHLAKMLRRRHNERGAAA